MNHAEILASVEEMFAEKPRDPREEPLRRRMIARLFAAFAVADQRLADVYASETDAIPIDKLAVAIQGVIRSHVWASLPRIGEIWRIARAAAGLGREQYRAGRYLPAPREWPPIGQRHGVNFESFEPLGDGSLSRGMLASIAGHAQLEAGEHS